MKLSPNEIQEELERVRQNRYSQFVKRINLRHVRGFIDKNVEFSYPVSAVIGTNGGGKSTIMGAAALAYKNVKPGQFFPKSFVGDRSMVDWSIEFELVDKATNPQQTISRTARFTETKWRRDDFPTRHVEYIEIQRTVPAGELTKFRKFIGRNAAEIVEEELSENTARYSSAVLDKDVSNYRVVHLQNAPDNKIYVGRSRGDISYSQFHFGAGEASIISTIDRIETAPDNALILIEEVENGLHPVAVRLFVQYLQSAARRKRLQVIFTTHSQDAIDQMPPQGIWASINSNTFHGPLSIESLRAVTGEAPNERVVFVEDSFVQEWVQNALGRFGQDIYDTTKVYTAGGYPNVVTYTQYHNSNPTTQIPAVGLVDGDIYDPETDNPLPEHCAFLGGGVPEATIFDFIYARRVDLSAIIRQRCLLSAFSEERIVSVMESVRNSQCDSHILFREMSERLNFVSSIHIQSGMIDIFNEHNPNFWVNVVEFVRSRVPKN